MARFLDSDDLIAVADHCVGTLRALSDRNWSIRATNDERSCREVIEHVCCLSYAPILALRAPDWIDLAFGVARGTPIEWVLVTEPAVLDEQPDLASLIRQQFTQAAAGEGWTAYRRR